MFTKELVAGYWMWQCKSLNEAIDWLKQAPFEDTEVEIRQVFETADFGDEFTPELREQEERLRARTAARDYLGVFRRRLKPIHHGPMDQDSKE